MYINKKDMEILQDIELYLYNVNKDKMVVYDNIFTIKKEDIGDLKAFELYCKLYAINEKLIKKGGKK